MSGEGFWKSVPPDGAVGYARGSLEGVKGRVFQLRGKVGGRFSALGERRGKVFGKVRHLMSQ